MFGVILFLGFTKGINYVASFVNLTTLNRTSGVEKRTPLCLGPWFVHQTLEIEKLGGSNNPVKLQTMILQNFFKGMKVVRGLVSRTALKFEGQNINNKVSFNFIISLRLKLEKARVSPRVGFSQAHHQ